MKTNHLKNVIRRELKQMLTRPIYIYLTIFAPMFCCIFFITFMNEGIPEKEPVGIIDHDNSTFSRRFVREIGSTQFTEFVKKYSSYQEAREAMQKGEIYAFLEIPPNYYSDVLGYRFPKISIYINNAYLVGGSLCYKDLKMMATLSGGAIQREVLRAKGYSDNQIMGLVQPIVLETHQIGNPYTSYLIYLANVILPGILELFIIVMVVFAIGYELKMRTSREWMKAADNSIITALVGKLFPYVVIFLVIGISMNVLFFRVLHFPMEGSLLAVILGTVLMVFASVAVGVCLIAAMPVLRDAISVSALYCVMAFSLVGLTLPIMGMHPILQGLCNLFPLRHYFMIYVNEALMGVGFSYYWIHIIALLVFWLLPFLGLKRLKNALIYQNYPLK